MQGPSRQIPLASIGKRRREIHRGSERESAVSDPAAVKPNMAGIPLLERTIDDGKFTPLHGKFFHEQTLLAPIKPVR